MKREQMPPGTLAKGKDADSFRLVCHDNAGGASLTSPTLFVCPRPLRCGSGFVLISATCSSAHLALLWLLCLGGDYLSKGLLVLACVVWCCAAITPHRAGPTSSIYDAHACGGLSLFILVVPNQTLDALTLSFNN